VVAIGTAGDRDDNAIEGIGRVAAEIADAVIIKDSEKYLRGREVGEMPGILRRVVGDGVIQECPNERSAFYAGLDQVIAGDTFAVMCIEDSDEIIGYLEQHANSLS
jgi:UDP-N-acetylmuramyl tripeptide synthase